MDDSPLTHAAGQDGASAVLPMLVTKRLVLQPITLQDVEALHALWTDSQVRRFLCDDRVISSKDAQDVVLDALSLAPQGLGLWLIASRNGDPEGRDLPHAGSCLGCAGLMPAIAAAQYDARLQGLAEPLIALWPAAWGCGIASEALAAVLQYASRTLALQRVGGAVDLPNVASDRMLRRAGFKVLGEVPGPKHWLRTYFWSAPGDTPNA